MLYKGGYIALISVLIITTASLAILTLMSVRSIYILNDVNKNMQSKDTEKILNSCGEDALLRLNQSNVLPTSIMVESHTCTIVVNSHTNNDWDFTVSYVSGDYSYDARITATRSDRVYLNSWSTTR